MTTRTPLAAVLAFLSLLLPDARSLNAQQDFSVIPLPTVVQRDSGLVLLSADMTITASHASLLPVARLASSYLERLTGTRPFVRSRAARPSSRAVAITGDHASSGGPSFAETIELQLDEALGHEAYELHVASDGIRISGGSSAGVFYGIQTLRQLLPAVHEGTGALPLPAIRIADAPRFGWRGMHVDVSRHFFSIADLRRFIDLMALYRFNRLHLHLTDDQGWRLEMTRYPELTSEGAWRELNSQDSVVLRQGRDNPDFHYLPAEHFRGEGAARRYGGFYTQQEMRELVTYAAARHVTIVPEIDMPGHMMAAIASYPELSCTGAAEWGDTFSVPLCPGKPEVLQFAENILDELVQVFPSPWIHVGGDEVEKATWASHAGTRALMEREGLSSLEEVQGWFISQLGRMLASRGRSLIGWDEILEGGLPDGATVMHWRGWVPDAPVRAVRSGSDVIRAPTTCCYFDYPESDGTLAQVYAFEPVPGELNETEAEHILGVQANLWSEWIASPEQLDYMAFPRMLALAEVAWTSANRRDWRSFETRLARHYTRLDAMGVHYRVPSLTELHERTVVVRDTVIRLSPPLPGIGLRYTTDGSLPGRDSYSHSDPLTVDRDLTLRTRALYPSGRLGPAQTIGIEKQVAREADEPGTVQAGLRLAYHPIQVTRVDSITGEPSVVLTVPDVSIPEHLRAEAFAVVLTGFVRVPQTGVYTFTLESDDGSTLHIGDRLVVNNDEPHGPRAISGQVALSAGFHPLVLRFFESGGGYTLQLRWSGPGVPDATVPPSAFAH
jgi:hexosaminidase